MYLLNERGRRKERRERWREGEKKNKEEEKEKEEKTEKREGEEERRRRKRRGGVSVGGRFLVTLDIPSRILIDPNLCSLCLVLSNLY